MDDYDDYGNSDAFSPVPVVVSTFVPEPNPHQSSAKPSGKAYLSVLDLKLI